MWEQPKPRPGRRSFLSFWRTAEEQSNEQCRVAFLMAPQGGVGQCGKVPLVVFGQGLVMPYASIKVWRRSHWQRVFDAVVFVTPSPRIVTRPRLRLRLRFSLLFSSRVSQVWVRIALTHWR